MGIVGGCNVGCLCRCRGDKYIGIVGRDCMGKSRGECAQGRSS